MPANLPSPLRSLLAFVTLPGVMAGLIPWGLSRLRSVDAPQTTWGVLPVVLGAVILVLAVVSFHRRGKGTLAPWDPPKHLVVQDLYRFNRNPMYLGVLLVLIGWAFLTGNAWNHGYVGFLLVAFHLRIVLYEEREMQRLFREEWEHYRREVPRWGVRLTPYRTKT